MTADIIKDALRPWKYIDMNGEIKTLVPEQILNFDTNNLIKEMQRNPNIYNLVGELAERKRLEAKDLDTQLDALRGTLYIQYVQDESLKKFNGGRKPPESMLTTAIQSDPKFVELSKQRNQADYQFRCLNWLAKAIDNKADMMQSISANQRQQQKMIPQGGFNG